MIYCVEDDSNIRELVVYTLESTGMKACGFPDGTAFMKALAFETPELVLLDIMLPGGRYFPFEEAQKFSKDEGYPGDHGYSKRGRV